jgi:hypothetical protein
MPNNWEENIREGELRCKLLNGQSKKMILKILKMSAEKGRYATYIFFILIEKSIYSLK